MSIPTPDQRREATAARLRAIIEWISNDLGDHARAAVQLDDAVHDLEVHAIRVGLPYRPPRYDDAHWRAVRDAIASGAWVHCSPALLRSGVDCAEALRRPCECPGGGSHDHYVSDASCRHYGARLPAPSYLQQETGYAPDPFEWPADEVRER